MGGGDSGEAGLRGSEGGRGIDGRMRRLVVVTEIERGSATTSMARSLRTNCYSTELVITRSVEVGIGEEELHTVIDGRAGSSLTVPLTESGIEKVAVDVAMTLTRCLGTAGLIPVPPPLVLVACTGELDHALRTAGIHR